MRRASVLCTLAIACAVSRPALAINSAIGVRVGHLYLPYHCPGGLSLPADDYELWLGEEDLPTVSSSNDYDNDDPEDCTVTWFMTLLEEAATGLYLVDTHGRPSDGCICVEVYRTMAARDWAYSHIQGYNWEEQYPSTWEITKLQSTDGRWAIGVHPRAIAARSGMYANGLVIVSGCGSLSFLDDAWPGSKCRIGGEVDGGSLAELTQLVGSLCGGFGKAKRSVSWAMDGMTTIQATSTSDKDIVLAPVVLTVSPPEYSQLSSQTDTVEVTFDTKMRNSSCPVRALDGQGALAVMSSSWTSESILQLTVSPYRVGACGLAITDKAVAGIGAGEAVPLDGNQDPAGSDGLHPSGDEFHIAYDANFVQPPPGAAFETAWAFPEGGTTHVCWVTDSEWESDHFEVTRAADGRVLATVPSAGSVLRPHYYETAVEGEIPGPLRVVEVDTNDRRLYATPAIRRTAPPDYLPTLRQLNTLVLGWPSSADSTPRGELRTPVLAGSSPKTTCATAPDFIYYSSRSDFLALTQPVRDWWAANYGLTSVLQTGGSSAESCREALRSYYNQAVECHKTPHVVIVGEANQGELPERNIVGTFYYPDDEQSGCQFGGCASDASIVDFDADGIPDLPWSRVVVCTTAELQRAVDTALDWYGGTDLLASRALILGGTQHYMNGNCIVEDDPEATLDEIAGIYSSHGVPTQKLYDGVYGCSYPFDLLLQMALSVFNTGAGVREITGTGLVTNRSRWPGDFIQKTYAPAFTMGQVTRPQRLVCILPGCGIGDTDRNNPTYYPSLTKMFLTGEQSGASAVAILGHMRSGQSPYHPLLLRKFFEKRYNGSTWTAQLAYFQALRSLAEEDPGRIPYVKVAGSFGWPARLTGQPEVTDVEDPNGRLPDTPQLVVHVWPNPANGEVLIRLDGGSVAEVARVDVYSVDGRHVGLLDGGLDASMARLYRWDLRDAAGARVANGVYLVRVARKDGKSTQKVVVLQ
jgi:hypothetical protein